MFCKCFILYVTTVLQIQATCSDDNLMTDGVMWLIIELVAFACHFVLASLPRCASWCIDSAVEVINLLLLQLSTASVYMHSLCAAVRWRWTVVLSLET